MQHQSQDLTKGPIAGKTGYSVTTAPVITAEEIERHIAEGKRMQAEAVRTFFGGAFRRLGALFPSRHGEAPLREDHLSRA